MGFLKTIFGEKKEINNSAASVQEKDTRPESNPEKKVPSEIQSLVLLSVAEKYKTEEKNYPWYFRDRFGIGFPKERFQEMEKKGLIRPSTSIETLPNLKATELKSIASEFGLKATGKKEEICHRIAESISESELDSYVPDRYWVVTETGHSLLDNNRFISFYMEDHPYSFEQIDLDITSYAKLFSNGTHHSVRDTLWGEFNRKSMDYYTEGVTKGKFRKYCNLLQTMALFLEEENRHLDALASYMRFIYYRANFDAALSALQYYSLINDFDRAVDTLFGDARIYPFIANELTSISNACGFNSNDLKSFMLKAFSKEQDAGLFAPDELVEFVMCGLNGDSDGQKRLCQKVMKTSVKNVPKSRKK